MAAEVVAGEMPGAAGPAHTHTPIGYARVTVLPGTSQHPRRRWPHRTRLRHRRNGVDRRRGRPLERTTASSIGRPAPSCSTPADATDAFDRPATGEPIDEPMVRRGPFVMNTPAEIDEAYADFRAGRMGSIPATGSA
ncbi:MAG: pirin-like C-terminal cupin domain-containing protein [Acidimicrobiales bacterium]